MLKYPLETTPTGDIAIDSPETWYRSRARLFVDCTPGDRPMVPEFGSTVQIFSPSSDRAVMAEVLRLGLNRWCGSDDGLQFAVTVGNSDRLQLNITHGIN